jgi:hypothetical protein
MKKKINNLYRGLKCIKAYVIVRVVLIAYFVGEAYLIPLGLGCFMPAVQYLCHNSAQYI